MTETAKRMAERVDDAIQEYRNEVRGRDSDNPHLYNHKIEETGDGGYRVKYWSDQGWWHDCWITATIRPDGLVTFSHCGDEGMKELVRLIRQDIQ